MPGTPRVARQPVQYPTEITRGAISSEEAFNWLIEYKFCWDSHAVRVAPLIPKRELYLTLRWEDCICECVICLWVQNWENKFWSA